MSRIPSIPQSLKAWEDRWEEINMGNQAFVVVEEDFFDNAFQSSMVDTLKYMASNLNRELKAFQIKISVFYFPQ